MKLKAEDLFDELNPEERQEEDKKFKVESNPALDAIVSGYEKFYIGPKDMRPETNYSRCLPFIPEKYSAENTEEFMMVSGKYEEPHIGKKLGVYVSALVNNCDENTFTLHTKHLPFDVHDLGYGNNGKLIKIIGDGCGGIGKNMEDGFIQVDGNADSLGDGIKGGVIQVDGDCYWLGSDMISGEIIINGNVGTKLVSPDSGTIVAMHGGKIIINGDVGGEIGGGMRGGTICLNGKYDKISTYILGGDIYHKDKLIVKDGKRV